MEIYFEDYPDEILDFLYDHPQAWEDCCNHFGVDPANEDALDEIDIMDWIYDHDQLCDDLYSYLENVAINRQASMPDYYKDHLVDISLSEALRIALHEGDCTPEKYSSSLSIYSKLEESLNESSMPPIRKVLQDNKIMDTLDKDPQGTINKALQVVRDSDEISAKDKNTFANAVGKGPLSKKVSSLASYFYDVNRVGRRR